MRPNIFQRSFRCYFRIICGVFILSFFVPLLLAFSSSDNNGEDGFFSAGRYSINRDVIKNIADTGGAKGDIERFTQLFEKGIVLFENRQYEKAKSVLFGARDVWPEYFGTDFVIALSYEKTGDFDEAARFYKSYLVKLGMFYEGKYKISGSLIRFMSGGNVDRYGAAEARIKERLLEHGIRLDKVSAASAMPKVIFVLLILLAAISVFYVVAHMIVPFLKREYNIQHPPKGFWVCRNCGATSPELCKVCNGCGMEKK